MSDRLASVWVMKLLHEAIEDILGIALPPWVLLKVVHRFEELCDEQGVHIGYSEPEFDLYRAITGEDDTEGGQ